MRDEEGQNIGDLGASLENDVTRNESHLGSEIPLRGQDIPYPATRGDVTLPLMETDELNDPETMVRSLTPNMDTEAEPEALDPIMEWLQAEEGQPVLLDESLTPIAKSRTRPPRQLRSRVIGTVSWQPDVEQYIYIYINILRGE